MNIAVVVRAVKKNPNFRCALLVAHNVALLIQNILEKENINAEMMLKNQAVQISIEHVTIFLSK